MYNDLFALSCTTTTDLLGYPPEIANSSPTLYSAPPPHPPPPPPPPPPILVPENMAISSEFDSVRETLVALKSEIGYSSSGSYGSPSSLPSCYFQRPSLVQRSMSSHSLQKDGFYNPILSYLDESHDEILDLESGPMRKVFSTGDLQGINMVQHHCESPSPLSYENYSMEGMNKVGRYSAEERKERIERYKSKRSQRNFNKKIKYACRKTLADSRPRIRGRFARNEEIEESSQTQWNQMEREENEEDDDVWLNFFDAFSVNAIP